MTELTFTSSTWITIGTAALATYFLRFGGLMLAGKLRSLGVLSSVWTRCPAPFYSR
jgi:uncharacterized membrane protein